MAWATLAGSNPHGSTDPAVASAGMIELTDGTTLTADDINFDLRDLLHIGKRQLLSGVIVQGVITASALVLTFPSGFAYYAGQLWAAGTSTTETVSDNATTYLWGCSDGVIRQTTTTTPPTNFDARTACLLVKAVALSGVATLDISVQQLARSADADNRLVSENAACIAPVCDTIPAAVTASVPAGSQLQVFETLAISGVLRIGGKVRVTA